MKLPPQGTPNWENRTLFRGDNLEFLRAMNSKSVHLIATDPPFNKGKDFHATPDSLSDGASFHDRWSWEEDVHEEWVESITDDWPLVMNVIQGSRNSYGDDMGAFLCYMAVRLIAMRRILRDDGSIYLHCDPTASHYLKELLDAIFGKNNFRNEIVWCYSGGGQSKKDFPKKHDVILRYSKSKHYTFNADAVRVPYDSDYQATVFSKDTSRAPGKTYGPNPKGKVVEDWWRNIPRPYGKKRMGYPTEKPLLLYERIIRASSNEGDVVPDPFAGCATTCVAAERLKRQWTGIDIWEQAHEMVVRRLDAEGLLADYDLTAVKCIEEVPERTDDGETAAPFLVTRRQVHEPPGPRMTHTKMREYLLEQQGCKCQGCHREFDDDRYLELDHHNSSRRWRYQSCIQSDTAMRAMQSGEKPSAYPIRLTGTKQEKRLDGRGGGMNWNEKLKKIARALPRTGRPSAHAPACVPQRRLGVLRASCDLATRTIQQSDGV